MSRVAPATSPGSWQICPCLPKARSTVQKQSILASVSLQRVVFKLISMPGCCGRVVSVFTCQAGGLWFKSGILPLLKHACGESDWLICWLYTPAEVSHQRCISCMPPQSLNKAKPTLKPRGDVTRSLKQGYQWPQKWKCVQQKF